MINANVFDTRFIRLWWIAQIKTRENSNIFVSKFQKKFVTEEELDKVKVYDVFLSFSQKGDDFVLRTLLLELKSRPNPYRVCVHFRDWIPGVLITEQVITSVRDSRRNFVIVSKNFLDSCSTKMEFRTAYTQDLTEGRTRVVDKQNVKCDGTNIQIIHADNICTFPWVIILVLVFFLFIISSFLASYYKWKTYIKMWLYYKGWLLWFVTEEELDKDKVYDVFLSFSQKDDDFVLRTLLPELESGPNPYKVCVHYRDWIPGVLITEQVITSVRDSRRTLVIVSKNFLESCWTKMEFRTAYTQALTEGRTRVIVLVYGEVDMTQIDGDLSVYMKMTTYINWEDPWFWKKMLYALPHKNRNNQIRTTTV
ncbi:unnamed protein product [Brassicogethes aeneus]|uniref:TIR domain-containing protein n=1 Tax=Brassicogethes aeneus TaxID=1431903 RepID=A0A9P0FP18_BRAAE|nr:unnamed protein product [Brassicogethes aeneus]